jgi:xanthine dehydrogenase accessory factor
MKDIYSAILNSLKTNRASVLATIISQRGSSPRGSGAKLLIMENGALAGSIGGGILEKAVIDASSDVRSSLLPMHFSSDPEMSCGGDVELFLEPMRHDNDTCLIIFKEVADIVRRGGSGLLATVTDARLWQSDQIPKALFKSSGEVTGFLPNMEETGKIVMDGMAGFLEKRAPEIIACHDRDGNELSLFIEPIISDPVLYIFGAGHISSQVVPLAHRVGFKVIVIDDRPEFSDPLNFPDAEKVFHYSYDDVVKKFPIDKSSYIVIVTHGHSYDQLVLGQALHTDAGYIGMIGSRRKISTIFDNLLREGLTREDLDRVHSPIGMDIGAETPEEIALSIVAELVKVRAGYV